MNSLIELCLLVDFRGIFKDIQKCFSPEERSVYIYPTTATVMFSYLFMTRSLSVFVKDTTATATTLESVRDGVLRVNLAASQLI
jgi:guanine nucleotide-binding protein alpha-1 subunit